MSAETGPRTEAGRWLLGDLLTPVDLVGHIAAIEAEAVEVERERLRVAVEGLTEHPTCLCEPEPSPTVSRAAVLALLTPDAP